MNEPKSVKGWIRGARAAVRDWDTGKSDNITSGNNLATYLRLAISLLPEEIRKAKEQAWDEAKNEVRSIPHWFDPENRTGGFDLSCLGPENSSEDGAFDSVMNALSRNLYRKD